MKLPGAPEMNIPSLTGSSDTDTETTSTLLAASKEEIGTVISGAGDSAKLAGSAIIVASAAAANKAEGAVNAITPSMDTTSATTQDTKPGFAIRPSTQNEQKEIIDNTSTAQAVAPKIEETAKKAKSTVIASASNTPKPKKIKKAFKPEIIEKKKPAKPVAPKQAKAPKKPTAKAVAPTPSAAPSGKYSIQLLATSSQSRAAKLAKTMKTEGYNVFVTQTTRENKILYRVRVGSHTSRNAAIKSQDSMKKRYQKNFFVQNSLVISN